MNEELNEEMNEATTIPVNDGYSQIKLPVSGSYVSLNQMTGIEEEILADTKLGKNAGKLITALLHSVITSVDGKKINKQYLRDMFVGDRDAILLELRKISLGNTLLTIFNCPSCGEKLQEEWDLDLLDTKVAEGTELEITLTDGLRDKEGNVYTDVIATYPTGAIQEQIAMVMKQNTSKGNTLLLQKCIKSIGGVEKISTEAIRRLTKRDRDILIKQIDKDSPGVDFNVSVTCEECGNSFESFLDLSNFFSSNL